MISLRSSIVAFLICAVAIVSTARTSAFHLPGAGPKNFAEGETMEIYANVLTSVMTHLPFEYYSLPVCKAKHKQHGTAANLGEILLGDRVLPSPYESIVAGENVDCEALCGSDNIVPDEKTMKKLENYVKWDYHVNLILDSLPLAMVHPETGTYSVGVPLGYIDNGKAYLYNHIHFTIKYYELSHEERVKHHAAMEKKKGSNKHATTAHADEADEEPALKRIISFVGHPISIKHDPDHFSATCYNAANFSHQHFTPLALADIKSAAAKGFRFTYGVTWEKTDELWTTRWDVYLNVADHEIHWFAIINATLIVVLLSVMVVIIMMRVLNRDIASYNRVRLADEDLSDETGWKLVCKDVFRAPEHPELLAAIIGSGAQLLGMTVAVIVVAALGFLAPSNRGALFTALLIFFVFLGVYGGYNSARFLKLWDRASWMNILLTGTLVPGITFATFFTVNLAVWSQGSSGAVPLLSMVAVVCLWFFISVPLVFIGAVFGFRSDVITVPVQPTAIPRHVPQLPWHMQNAVTIPLAGILPFGAVFLEFFFILSAVWLNRYYYVFGFLLLVFIILVVTCAEITIVLTYFQLCSEDYNWYWRSFVSSGACAAYIWLYAVYYFFSSGLHHGPLVPMFIYFSYMSLLSFLFFVATGTIGFLATFQFLRLIYSKIRIE